MKKRKKNDMYVNAHEVLAIRTESDREYWQKKGNLNDVLSKLVELRKGKDGKYYSYHSDVIELMDNVEFKIWDIIIIKWKNCIGQCFASQVDNRKITAKQHEYLIVGKKIETT